MAVGEAGHHVPAVRKSQGRVFEVSRSDLDRPTLHPTGDDPALDHWRLHDAERGHVGPRQGDFKGTDQELMDAYRSAYAKLDEVKVDVRSPNNKYQVAKSVTPLEAVNAMQKWLEDVGLWKK
jgi:hypothetical protein